MHFLQRRRNQRIDEYGGSLENRARLFREVLEETKETVGDRCAVAVRLGVEELLGPEGITAEDEGREIVEMLAELPDLWDVNVSNWENPKERALAIALIVESLVWLVVAMGCFFIGHCFDNNKKNVHPTENGLEMDVNASIA